MFTLRRSMGFAIVVLLSLAFLPGLIVWSVESFLTSFIEPFASATLKDGEIWFAEYHTSTGLLSSPLPYCEVKCINLTTGVERSTALHLDGDVLTPFWAGDVLYLFSSSAVYQSVDMGPDKPIAMQYVVALPNPATRYMMTQAVFLYDGELTTAVETQEGGCQLVHLRDSRWVNGRKIRLPPQNFAWCDNLVDGRKKLQPVRLYPDVLPANSIADPSDGATEVEAAVAASPPAYAAPVTVTTTTFAVAMPAIGVSVPVPMRFASPYGSSMWSLQVEQRGEHLHLLYLNNNGFWAYRDGLESDDENDLASALAPENSLQDANGWEPIPPDLSGDFINQMTSDRDGVLFTSMTGTFIRRSSDGVWTRLKQVTALQFDTNSRIIADSSDATVYFVGDSGKVFRIEGNSIEPTNFKVADSERDYFARWQRLLLGFVGAWLLHYFLVATGVGLLTRIAMSATYEFGIQKATLAPPLRRGLAVSIDFAILSVILSASIFGHSRFLELNRAPNDQYVLMNTLMTLEDTLAYGDWQSFASIWSSFEELMSLTVFNLNDDFWATLSTLMIMVSIDTGLVLWLLKVYDEGRYGLTPGKWLLGIRTLRTTLRHCGLSRAIVRDVLLAVDLVGFVTPLPAAASLVFSSNRQRWGDHVADTIVVDEKSTAPFV